MTSNIGDVRVVIKVRRKKRIKKPNPTGYNMCIKNFTQ